MRSQELYSAIAKNIEGVTKVEVEAIFKEYAKVVKENVSTDNRIPVPSLGNFELKKRNARNCRNPQNGEMIEVPSKLVPNFRISPSVKDELTVELEG